MNIPFNKPYLAGKELDYIKDAVNRGKISGNGYYTNKCQEFFQQKYGFKKCLLTTSCTDALEMAALLSNIQPGDEVIVPSYTFVSTANAFVLRGAKIVFADSRKEHPGIDESKIESLITSNTKVIVPVHYAGVACDMNMIMNIANRYNLLVVEDAAQAIDSYYVAPKTGIKQALGAIGHLGCFSFHETKNIQCGEGGMIIVNHEKFFNRSEIIWEKGTNRSAFWRGEIDKYGWIDIGSSFLPSEIQAAFLYAQIEKLDDIQKKRKLLWNCYYENLFSLVESGHINTAYLPEYATQNAHMFYIICNNLEERTNLIIHLRKNNIHSVFHYQSLHQSEYFRNKHNGSVLPNSNHFTDCLLRLPFYYELNLSEVLIIVDAIKKFYKSI